MTESARWPSRINFERPERLIWIFSFFLMSDCKLDVVCIYEEGSIAAPYQLPIMQNDRVNPEGRGDGDPLRSLRTSGSFRLSRDGRTLER